MEGGRIVQTGTAEDIVLRLADGYVAQFVQHLNPLTALKSGTVMRPRQGLLQEDGGIWLDRDRSCHLTLDQHGRPSGAMHKGERMAVTALDGFDAAQSVVPAGLLVVPHSFPLHLMVHLRQVSGHPMLLASEERFARVCDDGDNLRALCGVRGGVTPAAAPAESALV